MSADEHHGNGTDPRHWTEKLRAEPAPLPELSDHPLPIELARAYASLAFAYLSQHPVVVEALRELHGTGMGNRAILERIERRLAPGAVSPVPGSFRDPDASSHDWSIDLAAADRILREQVKDPHNAMTSERARQIARDVRRAAEDGAAAARWRAVTGLPARVFSKALENSATGLVMLVLGILGTLIWHFFLSHR